MALGEESQHIDSGKSLGGSSGLTLTQHRVRYSRLPALCPVVLKYLYTQRLHSISGQHVPLAANMAMVKKNFFY